MHGGAKGSARGKLRVIGSSRTAMLHLGGQPFTMMMLHKPERSLDNFEDLVQFVFRHLL